MDAVHVKYSKSLFIVVLVCILSWSHTSEGAQIKWPDTPYSYISKGEPLREMLLDFCALNQLNPVISKKIEGPVNGHFLRFRPQKLFEHIITAYGLIWYYDGNILYIGKADEMASRIIRLTHVTIQELLSVLRDLDIFDIRYPIKSVKHGKLLYVSGPNRYIDLVVETARLLDVEKGSRKSQEMMQVFVLKNAWADDRTFYFMDNQIKVPGVASILRNILSGGDVPDAPKGTEENRLPNTVPKLKGTGLALLNNDSDNKAASDVRVGPDSKGTGRAVIQADTRLNAVIIKDSADQMEAHRRLIEMLDVPAGLVEIQAAIIDVRTENLHELGISWRFNTNHVSGGFRATDSHVPGNQSLDLAEGLSFVTTMGGLGKFFLSKVEALQKEGKANILARPSVLTLDNQEARLEHSQTFYVKVAGSDDVDLFKVSAGIVLKVTPHIITTNHKKDWKIRLTVKIEDGSLTGNSIENIPVVQNSTINTQAVVQKNESLLIGGYSRKSTANLEHKVPILGDIPLMGMLFRYSEEETSQTERFFIIMPRMVIPHGDELEIPGKKSKEYHNRH